MSDEPLAEPQQVNLDPVAQLSAGGHVCARTQAGRALCWGNDASGQLGTGSVSFDAQPVPQTVHAVSGSQP
jgi:alpha-tubulin suppressor-like RCC1 family protein